MNIQDLISAAADQVDSGDDPIVVREIIEEHYGDLESISTWAAAAYVAAYNAGVQAGRDESAASPTHAGETSQND